MEPAHYAGSRRNRRTFPHSPSTTTKASAAASATTAAGARREEATPTQLEPAAVSVALPNERVPALGSTGRPSERASGATDGDCVHLSAAAAAVVGGRGRGAIPAAAAAPEMGVRGRERPTALGCFGGRAEREGGTEGGGDDEGGGKTSALKIGRSRAWCTALTSGLG